MRTPSWSRPFGLAFFFSACCAGSSIEIPSYYRIVFPGNRPPGGRHHPSREDQQPWERPFLARYGALRWPQLFRRNNGSPSFLVLPGLDDDKPSPSTYANADLDEDGAVTVYDYNLLSANFYRQGDVY